MIAFETALKDILAHASRVESEDVYNALCSVVWGHKGTNEVYGCSWRYAGDIVSHLSGRGEGYLDYYASGKEGVVVDWVKGALEARGWYVKEKEEEGGDIGGDGGGVQQGDSRGSNNSSEEEEEEDVSPTAPAAQEEASDEKMQLVPQG